MSLQTIFHYVSRNFFLSATKSIIPFRTKMAIVYIAECKRRILFPKPANVNIFFKQLLHTCLYFRKIIFLYSSQEI